MSNNVSILFYLKKPKIYISGVVPIYLRLTVNGKRSEISTSKDCLPEKWNKDSGHMNGTKEEAKVLNTYLDTLQAKLFEVHQKLLAKGETISALAIKNKFTGTDEKPLSLVNIFTDHNNKIRALLGDEFAPGTLERYKTSLKHCIEFLSLIHI